MTQYSLEPRTGIEYPKRAPFNHTNLEDPVIKEIHDNVEYREAVQLARVEASKVDTSESFPGDQVEVITLGTGSSIPAKYRNGKINERVKCVGYLLILIVSATLVKIPNYGSIMLDAGEGTYGQMMRRFGEDRVDEEISKIRCLFVSHLHADHHLGVVQLINKWNKVKKNIDFIWNDDY